MSDCRYLVISMTCPTAKQSVHQVRHILLKLVHCKLVVTCKKKTKEKSEISTEKIMGKSPDSSEMGSRILVCRSVAQLLGRQRNHRTQQFVLHFSYYELQDFFIIKYIQAVTFATLLSSRDGSCNQHIGMATHVHHQKMSISNQFIRTSILKLYFLLILSLEFLQFTVAYSTSIFLDSGLCLHIS